MPAFTCSKLTRETLEQRCEICSKLTIKTPKRRQWPSVSIVNFEHVIAGWVNICFHIISPPFSVGGHLQSQILKREGSKKK